MPALDLCKTLPATGCPQGPSDNEAPFDENIVISCILYTIVAVMYKLVVIAHRQAGPEGWRDLDGFEQAQVGHSCISLSCAVA